MKKRIFIALIVAVVLVAGTSVVWAKKPPSPSQPYDFVNIGDPESEAGHDLCGWGPVEPDTHGGHWGGVLNGELPLPGEDGNCRVISSGYAGEDGMFGVENNLEDWASFSMDLWAGRRTKYLVLRAQEGHAVDSFYVHVDTLDGEPVFYWPGDDSATEYWVSHVVPLRLDGRHTIYLRSDQPHWSGWDPFGQVAFTWAKVVKAKP